MEAQQAERSTEYQARLNEIVQAEDKQGTRSPFRLLHLFHQLTSFFGTLAGVTAQLRERLARFRQLLQDNFVSLLGE